MGAVTHRICSKYILLAHNLVLRSLYAANEPKSILFLGGGSYKEDLVEDCVKQHEERTQYVNE